MRLTLRLLKTILKQAFSEWKDDKAPKQAAALAYYAVFSIGPLLLIAVGVASLFFGESAAREQILAQATSVVGAKTAETIAGLLDSLKQRNEAGPAALVGLCTLILAASGVFAELQDSLNSIWEVKPAKTKGVAGLIRKRLLSFGMVLVIGFLLLISLIATTVFEAIIKSVELPGANFILQVASFGITFGIITLLFASMFRYLPDAKIAWRDLWTGSALTALLFTIGKFLISLYLAKNSTASAFGAAGSLVLLLLWIYYSAQIFFFGAEFTQNYATILGSGITLNPGAVSTSAYPKVNPALFRKEAPVKTVHAKSNKHKKNDITFSKEADTTLMRAKKYYILGSVALAIFTYFIQLKRSNPVH